MNLYVNFSIYSYPVEFAKLKDKITSFFDKKRQNRENMYKRKKPLAAALFQNNITLIQQFFPNFNINEQCD